MVEQKYRSLNQQRCIQLALESLKVAIWEKGLKIFSTFMSPGVSRDRLKKAGASIATLNTNRKTYLAEIQTTGCYSSKWDILSTPVQLLLFGQARHHVIKGGIVLLDVRPALAQDVGTVAQAHHQLSAHLCWLKSDSDAALFCRQMQHL